MNANPPNTLSRFYVALDREARYLRELMDKIGGDSPQPAEAKPQPKQRKQKADEQ